MIPTLQSRLIKWVNSHSSMFATPCDDGVWIYYYVVDRSGTTSVERELACSFADARAIMGY